MEMKGARLAAILNSEIDAQTDNNTNVGDVIAEMGRAGGISSSTVGCEYDTDGKAFHCCLITKDGGVLAELKEIKRFYK